jgi:hypothetical protein
MEELKRDFFLAYHEELEQKRLRNVGRFLCWMDIIELRQEMKQARFYYSYCT